MSVSMYRSQADRLTKEIADLEKRRADEHSRATASRGDALRISNSLTRSTSESLARSKLRDIQRKEDQAAQHDKRVAQYSNPIATKRRSLTAAQTALERALGQARQKEEREAKRQRETEIRHIRELERARRESTMLPGPLVAPVTALAPQPLTPGGDYEYDVCLSFAGENRDYVEMVARGLKEETINVFYDEDETTKLWGKNLTEHFDWIYRKASRYCVMFISEQYARKPWTRHERRSALARALVEEGEYILPARFDDTELEGLPPTIAYLDLSEIAPSTLVEHIVEKVRASGGHPRADV